MKLHKYLMTFTLSTGLVMASAGPAHAGVFSFLEPSNIADSVKRLIAKQRIGANVNIVDAQVFDGLSAALKYKIESEPSYVDGYYTRLDKYTLDINANPGDLIDGNDLPLGFGINSNSEIVFARQFKKQAESLIAIPYTPRNLPLSADQAIRNLNPGDFVAITGHLAFVVSLNSSAPLGGTLTASGSTHVYISGDFLIHTFRMPNNKLRVKLIAVRGKGGGGNASVNFGDFKIIGFNYIDNRIKNWINLDPANLGVSKDANSLFMLDYVFDLNNAQAAQAYDNLIHKKTRFKALAFMNPTDDTKDIKEELLSDLSSVEDIVNEDHGLEPAKRRIDRVFKGSNDSESTSSSFKFGINLLRFEAGSAYAQNKVVHIDRDEVEQKYLLDTYQVNKKIKAIFGLFGDESVISTNMLFSTDDNWNLKDFVALTLGRELKMKNVSQRDYRKIQEHVKSVIPADQYAKIDWKNWDFSRGSHVNGYFKNEIFFHPDTLKSITRMDSHLAYVRLYNFVKTHGYPEAPPRDTGPYSGEGMNTVGLDRYEWDLRAIASAVSVVFDDVQPPEVRYKAFLSLKDQPLWQQYGGGFLMSLIPADRINSLIAYQMTFSAKGVDTVSFRFGNFEQEELYKSLMYIQRVITDRSFDLRLYTDENGEFKVH